MGVSHVWSQDDGQDIGIDTFLVELAAPASVLLRRVSSAVEERAPSTPRLRQAKGSTPGPDVGGSGGPSSSSPGKNADAQSASDACDSATCCVTIMSLSGERRQVQLPSDLLVADIQVAVRLLHADSLGCQVAAAPEDLRLYFGGRRLDDAKATLQDVGIRGDCTIMMLSPPQDL